MESFAPKSFSFGALSPSSIITRCKNTLKSISYRNLVICASSASSSGSVVTLLDYGAGNVRSEKNAIRYFGFEREEIFDKNENESDDNKEWVSSTCNYGDDFIASIRRGNVHAVQFHPEKSGDVGLSVLRRFLHPKAWGTKKPTQGKASKLAKRVIACLDVRTNDKGDLVVTKGDQYDVREHTKENEVRNLGKPVELAGQYYKDGADEVSFLNITGFRDFPLGDLPMLQVLRHASENVFVPLTVGGGIRDFTDANGRHYSSLEVASEYFRSGADKISIGSDAVYAAEEYIKTKVKTGKSSLEQISRVYGNQVRNLGKPVELGGQYFKNGADEVLKHTSENVFGAFASAMNVLTKSGVSQEGKVVSIGRKMKEKIKGYVSSLISFDKSRMDEFAEASNKKSITKQKENRGWFKVCLMVCLLLPNGLRCVRSEDTGNALIPGSTAMNSLLANKNLRGFEPSGRRQMAGFNYNNFPRGNSGTSNPPVKPANPYQRPCNAGEYCRQGKKGKN